MPALAILSLHPMVRATVLASKLSNRRSQFIGLPLRFEECFEDTELNKKNTVFFCCVDTMRARIAIWNRLNGLGLLQGQKVWIESRITSRVVRIIGISLGNEKDGEYYESTLYSDNEAFEGRCTDRMTYYGAGIAAGLMVSQLVNWLN